MTDIEARLIEGRLQAIEHQLTLIPKEPWSAGQGDTRSNVVTGPDSLSITVSMPGHFYSDFKDTAEFVADARQDIPWLVGTLRAAMKELAQERLGAIDLQDTIDQLRREVAESQRHAV